MENMDKKHTVPKWVLMNRPKIPQIFSAQFVCPSPKVWDFLKKNSLWVSVVHVQNYLMKVQVKVSKVVADHDDLLTQSRKIFF